MSQMQQFVGERVERRWSMANEWMGAAKCADPTFAVTGFYTTPKRGKRRGELAVEFEAEIVVGETYDV